MQIKLPAGWTEKEAAILYGVVLTSVVALTYLLGFIVVWMLSVFGFLMKSVMFSSCLNIIITGVAALVFMKLDDVQPERALLHVRPLACFLLMAFWSAVFFWAIWALVGFHLIWLTTSATFVLGGLVGALVNSGLQFQKPIG